jgi:cell fate regulator YaaT (PSP1 superfamily)
VRTPGNGVRPPNLVGVRLAPQGRTLEYDAGELRLEAGDQVMVDDRRGGLALALVTVASGRRSAGAAGPMGKVHRRAEPPDHERARAEQGRQDETLAFARQRAHARGLSIKFFRIEVAPGGERTTFYFSSEQRVDFRELVRDLAARLHHRIELRQVGVRDEAKMVGGIGSCGRELCCSTFLPHFAPVTIRMAKNQNLALNPSRVSGQCGRLKCCLVYEEAQYLEAGKALPRHGRRVDTPDGPGRVEDLDVLRGRVRVSFPDRPPATYAAADLRGSAGQSGSDVGSPGGSDDGSPGGSDDRPDDGSGSGEPE